MYKVMKKWGKKITQVAEFTDINEAVNYILTIIMIWLVLMLIVLEKAEAHDAPPICDWSLTLGVMNRYHYQENNPYGDIELQCEMREYPLILVPYHHRTSVPDKVDNTKGHDYYGIKFKIDF